MRFERLILVGLSLLVVAQVWAALPTGTGSFSFVSERSGETMTVHYVKARSYRPERPPVVVLHGMNRNPDDYRDGWLEWAERYGLLVVSPHFDRERFPGTRSYNLGNLFPSESEYRLQPESEWTYPVPGELFDNLVERGETRAEGYLAFGHSAGSQFLHRAAALCPDDRLLLGICANAGWYTFPDPAVDWPYGWGRTWQGKEDIAPYLSRPLVILLGEKDTDTDDSGLRKAPEAMEQGPQRLARGQWFYRGARDLAAELGVPFHWRLELVPGVGHDQAGMAKTAAAIMAEYLAEEYPLKD